MATAMQVLEEVEVLPPAQEKAQQGSNRLLEDQYEALEAEIERAEDTITQADQEGEILYSEETLQRAITFLRMHIKWLWRSFGVNVPIPVIGPGPDGSVDLFWNQSSWELLVNISADAGTFATFYGNDRGMQRSKGRLDPKKVSPNLVLCQTNELQ
jgi:hypothetical protein